MPIARKPAVAKDAAYGLRLEEGRVRLLAAVLLPVQRTFTLPGSGSVRDTQA
jgi:hypothetical protein